MSTAYAKTLNHMFIFLSYKKFIGGAGLLVQHHAQDCYCIPWEDRGLCVSPGAEVGAGGGEGRREVGGIRLPSPQRKGHRA